MAATSRKGGRPKKLPASAKTLEARENQLVSQAITLAEKQIAAGTASSQVITHFLKLGTTMARLEREKLAQENLLLIAKIESLNSNKAIQELYAEALKAMRSYGGQDDPGVELDD